MQLECLSQLHPQRQHSSHVYYVPAPSGPPAISKQFGQAESLRETEELSQPRKQAPAARVEGPFDPLESKVLDEMRKVVSEPPRPTLLRRHTFAGDTRDLKRATGMQKDQDEDRQRRLAQLMLPGLKRELYNADFEEKGRLAKEIDEVQHRLGDDVPPARTFVVSRKCDREQDDKELEGQPMFVRSMSW
uniref:Uncharacterized protein n=1 Tax=Alexandrium andersonii TaxID=327968 RepID=A0A7S2AEZ6_9DINO